ncbi:MAG: hypothetical protein K0Q99_1624, partial [Clostridia bacterium]|nr:hypothetical protein [Clostridia bacterium]
SIRLVNYTIVDLVILNAVKNLHILQSLLLQDDRLNIAYIRFIVNRAFLYWQSDYNLCANMNLTLHLNFSAVL